MSVDAPATTDDCPPKEGCCVASPAALSTHPASVSVLLCGTRDTKTPHQQGEREEYPTYWHTNNRAWGATLAWLTMFTTKSGLDNLGDAVVHCEQQHGIGQTASLAAAAQDAGNNQTALVSLQMEGNTDSASDSVPNSQSSEATSVSEVAVSSDHDSDDSDGMGLLGLFASPAQLVRRNLCRPMPTPAPAPHQPDLPSWGMPPHQPAPPAPPSGPQEPPHEGRLGWYGAGAGVGMGRHRSCRHRLRPAALPNKPGRRRVTSCGCQGRRRPGGQGRRCPKRGLQRESWSVGHPRKGGRCPGQSPSSEEAGLV